MRTLARAIAGENASEEQRELACQVAAAQIDILRVRRARLNLLKQHLADENFQSRSSVTLSKIIADIPAKYKVAPVPSLIADFKRKPTGDDKLATIISDFTGKLMQFDRYERRALSRRKVAIMAFDRANPERGRRMKAA